MISTLTSNDPVLAEFAELVGDRDPVSVAGGRTRWNLGGELDAGAREITAPTGIVEYQPEEMTVAVRAGTTVEELHSALEAKGQRTALPERGGTIGGALAAGENGIHAVGRGLIRTALLQIRYVSAEGRIVNSGGPTVKNVSGFDLPRLMVGSLGTLGLLAEVILRTNPIPPVSRWLVATDVVDPQSVLDALLAPSCVLWDGTNTWVQLEGHGPDVASEAAALGNVGTFTETALDGFALPPHRWHAPRWRESDPSGAPSPQKFVEAVGLGLGFADEPQPVRELDPALAQLNARVKELFDPSGRLNPGRDPAKK